MGEKSKTNLKEKKAQEITKIGSYIIFSISGGIGKNIMATAVITSIKKQYQKHKLIVVTAYPEVYLNNPKIYRVFKFGITPYFMEDYVKDDTLIMQLDPYLHDSFIHKKKHLIEAWCDTYNVKCVTLKPEIYLTQREIQFAKEKFNRNRPLFIIQTNGGAANPQDLKYSWSRDIPQNQAQQIVHIMNETHHVMHIRKPEQLALENCEPISAPLRELFALISISDKRLFNESFGYHCATAFKLPSTVCFIGTKPEVYSYDLHDNVTPKDKKTFIHTIDKYMEDTPWGGEKMYECPYDLDNLFSITEIIESIKKQPNNNLAPKPIQQQTGHLIPVSEQAISHAQQNPNQFNPQQNPNQFPQTMGQNAHNVGQMQQQDVGNFIDNYFDKIYVINLDRRTDRLKEVKKQLDNANIKNWSRMPGVEITDEELAKYPKEQYANFSGLKTITNKEKFEKNYIKGSIGIKKAHINCLLDAKKNNYKKILILEDDVIIEKNANQLFYNIINEIGDNWGLLYLGGDYWENNKTFQTSSYALDSNVFDFIINNMEKSGDEIDFFFVNQVQKNFLNYRATPMIMIQSKKDSDIPTNEIKKI